MGYLLQDVGGSIPAHSAQSSEAAFDSLRVRKVELSPPKLCTKDRAVGQNCDPYTVENLVNLMREKKTAPLITICDLQVKNKIGASNK